MTKRVFINLCEMVLDCSIHFNTSFVFSFVLNTSHPVGGSRSTVLDCGSSSEAINPAPGAWFIQKFISLAQVIPHSIQPHSSEPCPKTQISFLFTYPCSSSVDRSSMWESVSSSLVAWGKHLDVMTSEVMTTLQEQHTRYAASLDLTRGEDDQVRRRQLPRMLFH